MSVTDLITSYSDEEVTALALAPAAHLAMVVDETEPAMAQPTSPGDRVRALLSLGPVTRLATGIQTLDDSCRGGVPTRRLVVVGGAPGAGKTTLATHLGWQWAKAGAAVAFLAVDEGPEGALARIGQMEGISAERFEERDPHALAQLASIVESTALHLVDADDAHGTVEGAASLLANYPRGVNRVLIVDSIQTIRAAGADEAANPRERIDAVVRALKSVRDKHGLLVLATCELSRAAYRSRILSEQIDPLASFKESGGIEYAAQTALVLRSVADASDMIDVVVPKNRAYQKRAFRLRLEHLTATFEEVPMPVTPPTLGGGSTKAVPVRDDAKRIHRLLIEHPGLHGQEDVAVQARSSGLALSNARVRAAVRWLTDNKAVEDRPEKGKPRLHADPNAFTESVEEVA